MPVRALALALALVLAPASVAAAPLLRADFHEFEVPGTGFDLTTADFDGDGVADLAVCSGNGNVTTFRGSGDGTYVRSDSLFGLPGITIAAADLNLDGIADLIVPEPTSRVAVLLGAGDGTFGPPIVYGNSLGGPGYGLLVGELTGDSQPDVAVGTTLGIRIYPGGAGGVLGVPLDIPLAGTVIDLAAADFDADLDTDLVVSVNSDAQVLLALGGGAFAPPVTYTTGEAGTGVVIGEFDGGAPDFICGGTLLTGLGNGAFVAGATFGTYGNQQPVAGDFDSDGRLDVATLGAPSAEDRRVFIHLGDGSGGFTLADSASTGFSPQGMVAGDWNGDGRLDLGVVTYTSGTVAMHLGNGDGSLGLSARIAGGGRDLAVADMTGDGNPDVLSAAPLELRPGVGNGSLGPPVSFAGEPGTRSVAVGDIDGDGVRDFVVASQTNFVSLFRGLGGGAFAARTDFNSGGLAQLVTLADLNGDGRDDAIVSTSTPGTLSIHFGQAGGALGPPVTASAAEAIDMRVAEVTGDSHRDVLLLVPGESTTGTVFIHPGSANGTLGTPVSVTIGGSGGAGVGMAVEDVTSDGIEDLLVANLQNVYLRAGLPGGGFAARIQVAASRRNAAIELADVDLDGQMDLVLAKTYPMAVAVYRGLGNGTFSRQLGYGVDGLASSLALGDLDGNGRLDIVAGGVSAFGVTNPDAIWILRDTAGAPVAVPEFPVARFLTIRAWPSPSRGDLRITFTLPSRGAVATEVLDLTGRRVHRADFGLLDAGFHDREIRLAATVSNGIYWLRLSQGSLSAVSRTLVLR